MAEQSSIKKDNKGFMYPNTNKVKPTQPDYTGNCLIDGKEKRMAIWENQTADGKRYFSITFSEPYQNAQQPQDPTQASQQAKSETADSSHSTESSMNDIKHNPQSSENAKTEDNLSNYYSHQYDHNELSELNDIFNQHDN